MKQEALIDALQAVVQEPVLCNVPMSKYTTWKIGGPADILVSPSTEDELSAIMRVVHDYDVPWMVVGNGSNLLVADKGIRGVVIHMGGSFSHSVWNGCEVEADSGMLLAT